MLRRQVWLVAVSLLIGAAGCASRTARTANLRPPPYDAFERAESGDRATRMMARETAAENATASHAYAGLPRSTRSDSEFTLLVNSGYAVGYSESRNDPLWAAYFCKAMDDPPTPQSRPSRFKKDERTNAQLVHADYTQSDYQTNPLAYDRGHMAPNYAIATRFGRDAQLETFLMSNICPQRKTLNQQTWEALEKRIAQDYSWEFDGVWVIVGPIFGNNPARLNGKAAIPDAFYAIIIDDEDGWVRVLALVMDQNVRGLQSLRDHVVYVRDIENATGLDFLSDLPDRVEEAVETSGPDEYWELDALMIPTHWNN